jgi:hypothetical protein
MTAKIPDHEPFPLGSAKEVVDYIRGWLEQDGPIRIDPHLKVDRSFRNVSTRDCKYVLSTVTEDSLQWPIEWDETHRKYVLHISGTDLDGQPVEMLFNIYFDNFKINVFNWKS